MVLQENILDGLADFKSVCKYTFWTENLTSSMNCRMINVCMHCSCLCSADLGIDVCRQDHSMTPASMQLLQLHKLCSRLCSSAVHEGSSFLLARQSQRLALPTDNWPRTPRTPVFHETCSCSIGALIQHGKSCMHASYNVQYLRVSMILGASKLHETRSCCLGPLGTPFAQSFLQTCKSPSNVPCAQVLHDVVIGKSTNPKCFHGKHNV